ncbi:transposase domain-containing protein [Persicobacter psychrovividus]|uniref:Transposase n=1 Tax=Persicobacter psychrovividus TaxID=387638 RepID=A0ABN6LCB2_9BACT|nr:hypothetical protein PEPS_13040 [Persicobacter psychrovividus]
MKREFREVVWDIKYGGWWGVYPDNNLIENQIRPIAIGRKNYMFVGSETGGHWAAMFYSFFATCKLNGINPMQWLTFVFEHIHSTSENELENLLPQNFETGE